MDNIIILMNEYHKISQSFKDKKLEPTDIYIASALNKFVIEKSMIEMIGVDKFIKLKEMVDQLIKLYNDEMSNDPLTIDFLKYLKEKREKGKTDDA